MSFHLKRLNPSKTNREYKMSKFKFIFSEIKKLILKHKLYFLAPLLIILASIAFIFIKIGANIIMTFIYAGI